MPESGFSEGQDFISTDGSGLSAAERTDRIAGLNQAQFERNLTPGEFEERERLVSEENDTSVQPLDQKEADELAELRRAQNGNGTWTDEQRDRLLELQTREKNAGSPYKTVEHN